MVSIHFGDFGDLVKQIHGRHEVFDLPILPNALSLVREIPAAEAVQLLFRHVDRTGIDSSLAGKTFFLGKLIGLVLPSSCCSSKSRIVEYWIYKLLVESDAFASS